MNWDRLIDRAFNWLENHLPGLLASFGLGYKIGSKKTEELENELRKTEYEKEKLKNEKFVLNESRDPKFLDKFLDRFRNKK